MKITVNGESKEAPENITIFDYVSQLSFDPETVVVELNSKIVRRVDYKITHLEDGCVLVLIRFIGGG